MISAFFLSSLFVVGVLAGPVHEDPSAQLPRFDGASDVTFFLYTQKNPYNEEIIKLGDASGSPSFNPKNPTRFVIHGWMSKAANLLNIRNAYIATGEEINIVMVDWSGPAATEVPVAVKNVVPVGDYVGQVIKDLIATRGLDPAKLIVIGHSMGGHLAGIVGNRVGGTRVAEVIGLDPANGLFDDNPMEDQLDKWDGRFVQIIHTNSGGMGITDPRGDVDFYVNGGSRQPGCDDYEEQVHGCSHNRALDLFAESITSNYFVATSCDSYDEYMKGNCNYSIHAVMGEQSPPTSTGKYFINTNAQSPFAQGYTGL